MLHQSMVSLVKEIRDRWHPLFHLRRLRAFQYFLEHIDAPIWVKLYRIPHPVCIYPVRHATLLFNPRTIEPEIVALFSAIQKAYTPRVFWDVGAHVGYYSWLLKSMDKSIEVLMFEPDAVNLSVIFKTLAKSGLPSIQVVPAAVSDSDGEKTFSLDRLTDQTGTLENPTQSFVKRHYRIDPKLVKVKTVTIDSIRKSAKPVDFIKIDVEGHEAKVIAGAEQTIIQDHPILIFENFDHN